MFGQEKAYPTSCAHLHVPPQRRRTRRHGRAPTPAPRDKRVRPARPSPCVWSVTIITCFPEENLRDHGIYALNTPHVKGCSYCGVVHLERLIYRS